MADTALLALFLATSLQHSLACNQARYLGHVKVISNGHEQLHNNTVMTRCAREALFRLFKGRVSVTYSFSETLQQCIIVEGLASTIVTRGGEDWRSYVFKGANKSE